MKTPNHYDAKNCRDANYRPNTAMIQAAAASWAQRHNLRPVGSDGTRVHLLIIDDQADFSFKGAPLYVAGRSGTGAMDAHQNLVEFIYRNLSCISEITCTLDTHVPYQVFFNSAHLDESGNHPEANTIITADEYRHGKYRPNPAMAKQIGVTPVWLQKQFIHYCEQLEQSGKYSLMLWPYHCLLGTEGHRLAGVVDEARLFHSFARGAANTPSVKGGNPLTENYSIFRPEVTTCHDGRPIPGVQVNTQLLDQLLAADVVPVAGLAASHCVKTSIEDLLGYIQKQDPSLARKVYIMRDCTDSVVIPGVFDFTDDAEKAMQEFADAGMHLVDSTTPIQDWPDQPLSA
ncbi:hypothetical protein LCGC14_0709520 [marine sediment metagenome]|uniref:Isochorismatase-like domain-containing protein n=1 Tax=marine sediment metagenome TaxID=412755 RepID=A0A0F9QFJ2_9ZZZZ